MQITELIKNHAFIGLIAVLVVAMTSIYVNKPDSDLEQRVSDLENRVALLEEAISGTDTIDISEMRWREVENWRKLRVDMSEEQVQELLGRPLRVHGGTLSTWYYSEGGIYSVVRFGGGKLISWVEPR